MKLTPQAKSALEVLQEKHLNYTISKATIESELKKELQVRLASARHERNIALRIAAEAGVPKTQLGKAIGTTNYRTVQDILSESDSGVELSTTTNKGVVVEAEPTGGYRITISKIGDSDVAGSAVVSLAGDNLEFISGDQFVIPQVYRNNFAEYVIEKIRRIS